VPGLRAVTVATFEELVVGLFTDHPSYSCSYSTFGPSFVTFAPAFIAFVPNSNLASY